MTNEMQQQPLIEMKKINKYYQVGEHRLHILRYIDLQIYRNEFVTIMGPSGSGKSTLINVLGFLDNKFEGHYNFDDKPVEARTDKQISVLRNEMVGFVFQDFNLIPTMTVNENIRLPLLYKGMPARKTKERVQLALESVGLGNKFNSRPHELSGGQKQRIAIARALINQPRFIIADEPTGALDTKTSKVIMDILARLHREQGVTVVLVTHDPNLQAYATRKVRIVDGQIHSNEVSESTYELSDKPLVFDEVLNNEDE